MKKIKLDFIYFTHYPFLEHCVTWSSNLLVLFIFMSFNICNIPLVVHKRNYGSIKASRIYLGILVGSSLILFLPAIIWVWYSVGTLNFADGGILNNTFDPAYVNFTVFICF